jgi:hypothetical protein
MKDKTFLPLNFTVIIDVINKRIMIKLKNEWTEFIFEEFDEWNSFKFGENIYDIHIHYDEELTASIYNVSRDNVHTDEFHNVKLYAQIGSKKLKL